MSSTHIEKQGVRFDSGTTRGGIRFIDEFAFCRTYQANDTGNAIAIGDLCIIVLNNTRKLWDEALKHPGATQGFATPNRMFAIAMEASTDPAKVIKFQIRGIVSAQCWGSASIGVVAGDSLAGSLDTAGYLGKFAAVPNATGATRTKVIGIALETAPVDELDDPIPALLTVLFDGISGFSSGTSS